MHILLSIKMPELINLPHTGFAKIGIPVKGWLRARSAGLFWIGATHQLSRLQPPCGAGGDLDENFVRDGGKQIIQNLLILGSLGIILWIGDHRPSTWRSPWPAQGRRG